MLDTNYNFIFQDFMNASVATNCDFRYILRTLLSRGAEEANYRHFLSDGAKAEEYRQLRDELEALADELSGMFDEDGSVLRQHRAILRGAVMLSRYLIAIEREETASQFEMLEERLRNPRHRTSYRDLKTA